MTKIPTLEECPTCGRSDFKTEAGIKSHHAQVHDEKLPTYSICDDCEEVFENPGHPRTYCDSCAQKHRREDVADRGISEKHRKEASKRMKEDNPMYDEDIRENHSEFMRQRMKELGKEGNHPMQRSDVAQKQAQSNSETWSRKVEDGECNLLDPEIRGDTFKNEKKRRKAVESQSNRYKVEKTGHVVDSGWEEEIDILLHDEGFNHEREPKKFETPYGGYIPDFKVENVIVEVKGGGAYCRNQEIVEGKAEYMASRDNIQYIVIGDVELPSDFYVPWKERYKLPNVIHEALTQVDTDAILRGDN